MKLVSFGTRGKERPGVVLDGRILDLRRADPALPESMRLILKRGLLPLVRQMVQSAGSFDPGCFLDAGSTRLGPPVTDPSKIICLGLNYVDHAAEQGKKVPEWPLLFAKAPSCLAGSGDPIPLPAEVTKLDHEVELAFVIGKRAKAVTADGAYDHIAGYGIFLDMSARDVQFREKQWFRGKSFDGFGPFGPWLVTRDEIADPHDLEISLAVDGTTMQKSNTRNLHFRIDYLVEHISRSMTLEPGDIISTGTPGGVGVFADPPRFLGKGQVVTAVIESLGEIENRIE